MKRSSLKYFIFHFRSNSKQQPTSRLLCARWATTMEKDNKEIIKRQPENWKIRKSYVLVWNLVLKKNSPIPILFTTERACVCDHFCYQFLYFSFLSKTMSSTIPKPTLLAALKIIFIPSVKIKMMQKDKFSFPKC